MARLIIRPLQTFLHTESAGGVLLLVAAVAALVWANSPWRHSYEQVWHTTLTVRVGPWSISEDLRHWINDALMAIFFFVVGLEIKRELVAGELRDPRAAALPAFGALGGMLLPAAIYGALNAGTPGASGWGIPMATDIAFAVGVVGLAGRGLPTALKLFLLALAIVDDIGAIAVIAIFYSGGISWPALGAAGGLLLVVVLLQRLNVRWTSVYLVTGAGVWLAVFESGVHATVAGVALGLMTPTRPLKDPAAVSDTARRVAAVTSDVPDNSNEDVEEWLTLSEQARQAVSPLARLEHLLHPWTSFLIVPLFALANAGVSLGGDAVRGAASSRVTLGIVLGLVVGKTLGIPLVAWAGVRMGLARLPDGVRWIHIFAVAAVAGIGFTVSLFIAGLAFEHAAQADAAKIGIFAGSLVAGILGSVMLAMLRRRSAAGTTGEAS